MFKNLFPENLYHSYIVEGDPETTIFLLRDFLEEKEEIEPHSNDMLCQIYDSFTINDAREIKEWHGKCAITKNKRICIIAAKFINNEAEQSLLKIIEEPHTNTHFFIIVSDASLLLDTILSRTHIVKIKQNKVSIFKDQAFAFVSSLPVDRLKIITQIIEDNKNNGTSGVLRFQATEFINEIETYIYKKFKKNKNDLHTQFVLSELQKSRMYVSIPGASVKMTLEHIALVL